MIRFAFIGAVVLAIAGTVAAQDWQKEPSYGSVTLRTGFEPDPHTVNVQAGGPINARHLGGGCAGYIADAPDYRVQFDGGSSLPLIFSVQSPVDTALVINAPDGQWYCNDDYEGSLNPTVRFGAPQAGQYDVWVGTFQEGALRPSQLFISERERRMPTGPGPNIILDPTFGSVMLMTGFQPDPHRVDIEAGGPIDAQGVAGGCAGFIARAPDYRVHYRGGASLPLIFFVRSEFDTTLVINAPDGQWYCNDDEHGMLHPSIRFASPQPGQYDVWVGTITPGDTRPSTLFVTEIEGRDRQ